jgi:alkylation response protein AidB-like acyl-CoA dehydrogenase
LDTAASSSILEAVSALNPYTEEEEMYRRSVRGFLDRELEPHWEKFIGDPAHDRELWRKAARAGILSGCIPEEYGGAGASEMGIIILGHELGRSIGGATIGSSLQADVATHILLAGGSPEQIRRWVPGILDGSITQCMPLTEPDAGSDATAIRTSAIKDGSDYIINGQKTYISNGGKAELMYVVAKTDPTLRSKGMSMIIVDRVNTPGITVRPLQTSGAPAYDVAEIFFDNVRVPQENIMLGEGRAMEILLSTFALDRLTIAARALGEAQLAYDLALDYARTRKAFGQLVIDFQNTQFVLAEIKTDLMVGETLLNDGIRHLRANKFDLSYGSMQKLWMTEMSSRVVDKAVQIFGGAGFMEEMPIARLYKANRLGRIYAGTSEVLKVGIARAL